MLQYMFQSFRDRYQRLLLSAFSPYDTSKTLQLRNKLSQEELQSTSAACPINAEHHLSYVRAVFEAGSAALMAAEVWRDNTDNSISTNKGKASRKRRAALEAANSRDKENTNPALAGKDKAQHGVHA
jgi:hypothetical protein